MSPDDPIRRLIDELVNAWNRGDAGAFGGLVMPIWRVSELLTAVSHANRRRGD